MSAIELGSVPLIEVDHGWARGVEIPSRSSRNPDAQVASSGGRKSFHIEMHTEEALPKPDQEVPVTRGLGDRILARFNRALNPRAQQQVPNVQMS